MDKIQAKTYLSNLVIPGASSRFMMKPVTTVTVGFDDLCKKVADASGLALSTVKYALECSNTKMVELLSKNCRVHTGLYVASLGIGGSVAAIGDQPSKAANPVHAVLTPEGEIVDRLAAIEVENVTVTVGALINEFLQSGLDEANKITLPDTNIVVNGRYIKIDTTKADEGCFLRNRLTGVVAATGTVVSTDSAQLVCKFATLPTAGQYEFVIATRNGDASMDVDEATRLVTVAAAA